MARTVRRLFNDTLHIKSRADNAVLGRGSAERAQVASAIIVNSDTGQTSDGLSRHRG